MATKTELEGAARDLMGALDRMYGGIYLSDNVRRTWQALAVLVPPERDPSDDTTEGRQAA